LPYKKSLHFNPTNPEEKHPTTLYKKLKKIWVHANNMDPIRSCHSGPPSGLYDLLAIGRLEQNDTKLKAGQ
jgi:hypothetical protein